VLTLPGTGREIALNGVTGLIGVTDVWWPYDSDSGEEWPPNQVEGFRLWWDDAQPILFLSTRTGNQPQLSDELRLWYTKAHTIQDLESAATTTVFPHHESGLVLGAAAYAAAAEAVDQIGSLHLDPTENKDLREWAATRLKEFTAWLARVRTSPANAGHANAFGPGWQLDEWDTVDR
jgi:hypothetical protein